MTNQTFADLHGVGIARDRCPGCGGHLAKDDRVSLKIEASRAHGRKTPDWLFRRAAHLCESCAVAAVAAAIDQIGAG